MSNLISNFRQASPHTKSGRNTLKAAHDLHERGLTIIPLKPKSTGAEVGWREFQSKKPTTDQINEWFAEESDKNLGILTGAASGIVVLVVETGSSSIYSYHVPRTTPMALTARAQFLYFKHPGVSVQNKENLLPGVHLLGDGAYVAAPPSVDESGDEYIWWAGLDKRPLRDMPEKLVNLLARKGLIKDTGLIEDDGLASVVATMEAGFNEDSQNPPNPAPPAANDNISSSSNHTLTLIKASDIEPEPIDWLWRGVLARGKLSMLAGDPGIAKSQLAISIAAAVSKGGEWPASTGTAKKGKAILLSDEDNAADTIVPRLIAANADLNEILILRMTGPAGSRLFDLNRDLAQLKAQIDAIGGVSLIIIDPITAYLGKKDANKMGDVRAILAQLAQFAESTRTCVLAINHFNKDAGKKAAYRMSGSVGFSAAARSVFFVVEDATDETRFIMAPLKINIGPPKRGFAYSVQSVTLPKGIETSKVVFEDALHRVTADELLTERRDGGEALKKAKEFLQDILGHTPMAAKKLFAQADECGIKEKTLQRAKDALGIKSDKGRDGWYWYLPGSIPTKSAPDDEEDIVASLDHPW